MPQLRRARPPRSSASTQAFSFLTFLSSFKESSKAVKVLQTKVEYRYKKNSEKRHFTKCSQNDHVGDLPQNRANRLPTRLRIKSFIIQQLTSCVVFASYGNW